MSKNRVGVRTQRRRQQENKLVCLECGIAKNEEDAYECEGPYEAVYCIMCWNQNPDLLVERLSLPTPNNHSAMLGTVQSV